MAKLSVIVPVYNVEDYVGECLESRCNQDYGDLEIVCVNDGSTDNSRSVLAQWQARDGRIIVVNQPNKGLSAARNTGIAHAAGDFLCFVDSDDKLEQGACRRIAEELSVPGTEVLVFGARTFPEKTDDEWMQATLSPRTIRYDHFKPAVLFSEASTPYVWRVAVAVEALHRTRLHFDETLKFGEDQLFLFSLYPQISGIQLISDKLYAYRINREGSLMSGAQSENGGIVRRNIEISNRIFSYWKEHGILDRYTLQLLQWSIEFSLYSALCQRTQVRDELVSEIVRIWETYVTDLPEYLNKLPRNESGLACIAVQMSQSDKFPSERQIKSKMVAYRLSHYGLSSFIHGVFRRLLN